MSVETNQINMTKKEKEKLLAFKRNRISRILTPRIVDTVDSMKTAADLLDEEIHKLIESDPDSTEMVGAMVKDLFKEQVSHGKKYTFVVTSKMGYMLKNPKQNNQNIPSNSTPKKVKKVKETAIENFKKNRSRIERDAGSPVKINEAGGAEMIQLASNYFRSIWVGGTTNLEDIRIPYREYITYIEKNAIHLDSYPNNWQSRLVSTLINDSWIFCIWDNVLHGTPFSAGYKGYTGKTRHPLITQKEDLDLKRYAKRGF